MNSYLRALLGMGTSDTDEEAEAYQLANYGTGGHFLPHHDFFQDNLHAYNSGDAAFWWNLKANGEGERLTMHAGCPVLYGSKWIANKWFWSYSNVFRLPCSTDRNASLAPLV
ncbi:hypothetical protein HPB47_006158 [Ixodes persulcatus]|uniref:Uncharacterized protein n=1 Tax=Ixodes persulcatus TaxID=34615 RepID=A0AC60PAY8_IXOPE|nr:hypothetical protein HPB47_006158 [Ixodes persulcatus]